MRFTKSVSGRIALAGASLIVIAGLASAFVLPRYAKMLPARADVDAWATARIQEELLGLVTLPCDGARFAIDASTGMLLERGNGTGVSAKDGWDRPMRLSARVGGGKAEIEFILASAGADGSAGNEDDVVQRKRCGGP